MSELTKLEAAVIEAICRQRPEHAAALRAQLASARVTGRQNTGCGMYTDFEVDPATPPLDASVDGPFGSVSSTVAGLELHFLVAPDRDGRLSQLEGYSFDGPDISDVDLTSAPFTPVQAVEELVKEERPSFWMTLKRLISRA